MKKLAYIAVIGAALFLLAACESGGDFNIVNRCSYPVYTKVDQSPMVTIPAGESHVFQIDTDTQNFLTGEVKRRVPVYIVGETFSLQDTEENVFTDSTRVTIRAGKTTNAYLSPNRASIKIVNNLDETISEVEIWEIKYNSQRLIITLSEIFAGESVWRRVAPATPQSNFSYRAMVWLEGAENPLEFGDNQTVLGVDEQWLLTLDPSKE